MSETKIDKRKQIITCLMLTMLLVHARFAIADNVHVSDTQITKNNVKILQSWHGDYPVAQLDLFPESQRNSAVGYIFDKKSFESVWKAFKPGDAIPVIDFRTNLVFFARNTQFYNRIRIGQVIVKKSVAELIAMETMSALPIEEKVAMSIVVVNRKGITGLKVGSKVVQLSSN